MKIQCGRRIVVIDNEYKPKSMDPENNFSTTLLTEDANKAQARASNIHFFIETNVRYFFLCI